MTCSTYTDFDLDFDLDIDYDDFECAAEGIFVLSVLFDHS